MIVIMYMYVCKSLYLSLSLYIYIYITLYRIISLLHMICVYIKTPWQLSEASSCLLFLLDPDPRFPDPAARPGRASEAGRWLSTEERILRDVIRCAVCVGDVEVSPGSSNQEPDFIWRAILRPLRRRATGSSPQRRARERRWGQKKATGIFQTELGQTICFTEGPQIYNMLQCCCFRCARVATFCHMLSTFPVNVH